MKAGILTTGLFALLLSGCAGYKPVDSSMTADVGDSVSVSPQVAWSKLNFGSNTVWTIDGVGLNEMRFLTGIKSGDPLLAVPGVAKKDMATFQSMMLPDEVMELVGSTLGKLQYRQIRTTGLKPVPFGGATGFRFDLNFANDDGLLFKGTAEFAERQGKLDLLLFIAPAEYYFDRYSPVVDRVFASVQTGGVAAAKTAR